MFDRYEDERQIVFGGVFQEELKQEGVQRINEVLFESAFTNAPISLRNVELYCLSAGLVSPSLCGNPHSVTNMLSLSQKQTQLFFTSLKLQIFATFDVFSRVK